MFYGILGSTDKELLDMFMIEAKTQFDYFE